MIIFGIKYISSCEDYMETKVKSGLNKDIFLISITVDILAIGF
jgi:hypothetical protein